VARREVEEGNARQSGSSQLAFHVPRWTVSDHSSKVGGPGRSPDSCTGLRRSSSARYAAPGRVSRVAAESIVGNFRWKTWIIWGTKRRLGKSRRKQKVGMEGVRVVGFVLLGEICMSFSSHHRRYYFTYLSKSCGQKHSLLEEVKFVIPYFRFQKNLQTVELVICSSSDWSK